ncbi:SWI/SNF and RSC complexes subunit arp9 [Cytospora mali]|uniref:SWI/SNF and RSC complexes subunit arp9 n=1 Tax=Cytospora mali TaxID=578113 RepID=A0A194UTX4_CYTMA|nr:SWI/SNF and RSC complexes subunit arp9 [Valsa mali var. pyri (nom. inval.)]
MSSQTRWREEQVLVICPGSSTTMAQLGCSELTPPSQRFPTRMFRDEETGAWRPYYTYKREKKKLPAGSNGNANGDAQNGDKKDEEGWEIVEDPDSTEGAVYPMQGGRIVNMEAFLAFLDHVHGMLTTTYHNTPIMLMASPQWTRPDCEDIARYVFEKTKTPALCLINSGVATQYGLRWPSMTVVDIGFEKVDVTCIYENRVVNHRDLGATTPDSAQEKDKAISGGEVFTRKLLSLLKDRDFTYDMAEQLKKSQICEVLPYAADKPALMDLPTDADGGVAGSSSSSSAAAAAPTGQPAAQAAAGTTTEGPVGPDADDVLAGEDKGADNDGVLDIANIVTSGQTKEFLAKKEREKAEKAKAGKKAKGQEAADASKAARLPNSKRLKNVFHYEEIVQEEPSAPTPAPAPQADEAMNDGVQEEGGEKKDGEQKEGEQKEGEQKEGEQKEGEQKEGEQTEGEKKEEEKKEGDAPATTEEGPKQDAPAGEADKPKEQQSSDGAFKVDNFLPPPDATAAPAASSEPQMKRVRRDIEIGLERFTFADREEIDRIATTIYEAVQSIGDMYMRPACWENITFVGNGSRIRGLKDNILQTLTSRHLISPSSATMFTSELPSNMATPSGTGAQTPTGSFTGPPHTMPTASSGVNPLLQAATTASLQQAPHPGMSTPGGPSGSAIGDASALHHMSHHFHSQTPTAIKLAATPTYLAEWTKHGFEEAMFLGSLVAARLVFCVHNMDAQGLEAQRLMSLNRVDFK